jgi:hypothetical protein
MYGFQLWANLPRARKMMDPRYQDVKAGQVPEVVRPDGTRIRVLCGAVDGTSGPVRDVVIEPEYLDVAVPAGSTFAHPTRRGHTVLAYVFDGAGCFAGEEDPYEYEAEGESPYDTRRDPSIGDRSLVLFQDGDAVSVATKDRPVRFLLISGKPIGEPVAWYGPIVMNTQEELKTAFRELEEGTFIKHR